MGTLQSLEPRESSFALPQLSPSLDARAIAIPPEGDPALECASQALGRARQAGDDMLNACLAIFKDETATMPARHLQMSKASGQIAKPGLQEIDRAHQTLSAQIEMLGKRVAAPPAASDVRAELRHKEIREALRYMSAADRNKAISMALAESDADVLSAVLNAPRLTTGLSKIEFDNARERWRQAAFGPEMKRLAALEKARDALHLGGKILLDASLKCYDSRVAGAAQKSQAIARAALASAG